MKLLCFWPMLIDTGTRTVRAAVTGVNGNPSGEVFPISGWMRQACIDTEADMAASAVRARYA